MAEDPLQTKPKERPEVGSTHHFAVLRVVFSPDPAVREAAFVLDGRSYEFGRDDRTEHRIFDERLSRRHFRLEREGTGYVLEDLSSTNGTFLDNQPVTGRVPLDGQVLSAGDTLFVVDPPAHFDRLPRAPGVQTSHVKGLVGWSNAMEALRASVATVAPQGGNVLLLGPTGVGKDVTARAIHAASGRKGPFVSVNCSAVPADLLESEFFGRRKGAFTDARTDRVGFFEASSGGTLFLDEVGDLRLDLQPKFLRALQESRVEPIGGEAVDVDLRVIAATNRPLTETSFRRDLLARLNQWQIHIPPLAERKADIVALWRHFVVRLTAGRGWSEQPEVIEALLLEDWPDNTRGLENLVARIHTLYPEGRSVQLDVLPEALSGRVLARYEATGSPAPTPVNDGPPPTPEALAAALEAAGGNVARVSRERRWHRNSVNRWLKKFDIDPNDYR